MKYTSKSTTKTTTKVFELDGAAPNKAKWSKREFLPDLLTVTYTEGKDGLKRIDWTIRGAVILKDGKTGVVRADASGWSVVSEFDEFQKIAEKNAPWAS